MDRPDLLDLYNSYQIAETQADLEEVQRWQEYQASGTPPNLILKRERDIAVARCGQKRAFGGFVIFIGLVFALGGLALSLHEQSLRAEHPWSQFIGLSAVGGIFALYGILRLISIKPQDTYCATLAKKMNARMKHKK